MSKYKLTGGEYYSNLIIEEHVLPLQYRRAA